MDEFIVGFDKKMKEINFLVHSFQYKQNSDFLNQIHTVISTLKSDIILLGLNQILDTVNAITDSLFILSNQTGDILSSYQYRIAIENIEHLNKLNQKFINVKEKSNHQSQSNMETVTFSKNKLFLQMSLLKDKNKLKYSDYQILNYRKFLFKQVLPLTYLFSKNNTMYFSNAESVSFVQQ